MSERRGGRGDGYDYEAFGKKVLEIRESMGMDQRTFAELIGVNHNTISRIERGWKHDPGTHHLVCLAAGILGWKFLKPEALSRVREPEVFHGEQAKIQKERRA